MRIHLLATVLVAIAGVTGGAQTPPPSADEHRALPQGRGRDLMIRVCSRCHSPELAADQQLDPAGWKALVDLMAAKGAEASDAELDEIVRYLATAFPPSKAH